MNSSKKRVIISLWVLSIFTLTMLISPSLNGHGRVFEHHPYTINGVDSYIEDFSTTTYLDSTTTAFGWGGGTITNSRNFTVSLLDYYKTESPVIDVDVQGRKAYIGLWNLTGGTQISVLNINNPSNIEHLGSSSAHSNTLSIAVDGDALFAGQITAVQDSIVSYDVQNPTNPHWTFGWGNNNIVTDIDPEGHLVYFTSYNATNDKSLRILYAENPHSGTYYINCDWNNPNALGLEVDGHLAYVAASTDGFYVLNISDKYTPIEYGHVNTPGNATDVIIDGRFAYITDGSEGVHVVNIENPTNPTIVSSFNTPGYARHLAKQGNTLFIADGGSGVTVLDVADPSNPAFVLEISTPYCWDVDLYGGDLVVATDVGVYTYQAGFLANFANSWYPNPFNQKEAYDVRVNSGIAYVAGGADEFYIVNVRNPEQPILLYNSTIGGVKFMKLDINEQFAFLVDTLGIYIFDISDLSKVHQVGFAFGVGLTDCIARGEIVYTSFTNGFALLNISNAYSPTFFQIHNLGYSNVTAIWVEGPTVYLVENLGVMGFGIHLYDITDFTTPVLLDEQSLSSFFYDIHVDGDIAQTANGRWVLPYNVSNPTSIFFNDYVFEASENRKGCWSFGPWALSAEYKLGVSMVNTTYLSDVNQMTNYPNANNAIQISAHGDYVYVANVSSLVILRLFESVGDTYISGTSVAQSIRVSSDPRKLITAATLDSQHLIPVDTNVEYYMSADGGITWDIVTPGTPHIFTVSGYDLRWKAELTGPKDRSVHIYEISINYEFNLAPTTPILTELGDTNFLGSVSLKWNESTDADGTIDHYEVEVSDSASFTTIIKEYNVTRTKKSVYPLSPGTYFFRVRAVDDSDVFSEWSTADIEVTFNLLGPMWLGIIIGGLAIIVTLIIVISILVRRKKKVSSR